MKSRSPLLQHILHDALGVYHSGEQERDREFLLREAAERAGVLLSRAELDELLSWFEKDVKHFGVLQPLIEDSTVTDVVVAGANNIAALRGRSAFRTDINFPTQEVYEAFVERMVVKAGASYSTKYPFADGMIGKNVRLHAVHKAVAEHGPYLTLRVNRMKQVSGADIVSSGMLPDSLLRYLQSAISAGLTIVIAGEVATGKTTLARVLASSYSSDESVLVIEDTRELHLDHPNVRYLTTREANQEGEGALSASACIKAGMRMAMGHVVVGELRDGTAAEAFIDAASSGHPGLTTIHGRDTRDSLFRLQLFLGRAQTAASGVSLAGQVSQAVQVVAHCGFCPLTKQRRVLAVSEVSGTVDGVLQLSEVARYHTDGGSPVWRWGTRASKFAEELEVADGFRLIDAPQVLRLDAYPSLPKELPSPIDCNVVYGSARW